MQGMRGVIAFAREQDERARRESAAANETWLAYPDDNPVRTVISGADSRAALAPLLAHQVGSHASTASGAFCSAHVFQELMAEVTVPSWTPCAARRPTHLG